MHVGRALLHADGQARRAWHLRLLCLATRHRHFPALFQRLSVFVPPHCVEGPRDRSGIDFSCVQEHLRPLKCHWQKRVRKQLRIRRSVHILMG